MSSTHRYEIFQKLASEQPVWVEAATSLEDAKKRLTELAKMFPADYFILELPELSVSDSVQQWVRNQGRIYNSAQTP
jgi:hypothetical protein